MCMAPVEYFEEEIDGECGECGNPTVEGRAFEGCFYSPKECETCEWKPCDGSC